ncbi:MAG: ComF family protein [Alphaproteobacteria bacterium]
MQTIKNYLNRFVDMLLPPRCFSCGTFVVEHHSVCGECFEKIHFIAAPLCEICGLPFSYDVEDETICGACAQKRPLFEKGRSIVRYDDGSKKIILSFKHGDVVDLVPAFVGWIVGHQKEFVMDADLLVPVPIHRWRLLKRRYNQAALVSNALGRRLEKESFPDLMRRIKNTPPQEHKSIISREDNVRGAFVVHSKYLETVRGKRILLIDDVFTTGATITSCTKVLLKAGASSVSVLTLARVVRDMG